MDMTTTAAPTITGPKSKSKRPRVPCAICNKPAIMYKGKTKKGQVTLIFEHRDEPPIREFIYKGRHKMYTYRRCDGGVVKQTGLPQPKEPEQKQERKQRQNYEQRYIDLLQELKNIVYDIDGDTAIRMIKNIRRMIEMAEAQPKK
jgi:hypothetical protein